MDALISHSSKSYYACVGESTHAYQSPSKDLTAINNRLNRYAYFLVLLTSEIRRNSLICAKLLTHTCLLCLPFTVPGSSEAHSTSMMSRV